MPAPLAHAASDCERRPCGLANATEGPHCARRSPGRPRPILRSWPKTSGGSTLNWSTNRIAKRRCRSDLAVLDATPKLQTPRPSAMRPSNEAALKSELNGANDTLIALQNRYTNLHPDVVAAQQRVRELQAELEQANNKNALIAKQDAAVQTSVNEAHARLAREAALQQQIAALDAQMARDTVELDALAKSKNWIPVVHYSAPTPAAAHAARAQRPHPLRAVAAPTPTAPPEALLSMPRDAPDGNHAGRNHVPSRDRCWGRSAFSLASFSPPRWWRSPSTAAAR